MFPVPPQILPFEFGEDDINFGDLVFVTCAVTKGDVPIKIAWTVNDKPVDSMRGITVDNNKKRVSQLSIDSVEDIHAGKYVCTAKNRAGTANFEAYLNVNGILKFMKIAWVFFFSFTSFIFPIS